MKYTGKKSGNIPECECTFVNRNPLSRVPKVRPWEAVRTDWGVALADIGDAGALGLSILVVESDQAARSVLIEHLGRHGFRIFQSEHGGAAIRAAAAQSFDFLVVDIDWVGVSDGAALARWMRTNRPQTRVVLTSTVLSHLFPAGSTMAALPLIRKPLRQEDLDRFLAPVAVAAIPGS